MNDEPLAWKIARLRGEILELRSAVHQLDRAGLGNATAQLLLNRKCADLMVMAGLWDEWKSPKGEHIKSCTIITCPPNKVAGALHDRMPVVLAPDNWGRWLGEEPLAPDELKALLAPCPDEALKVWPVDKTKIGNVRNKEREIAEPVSQRV